jgi:glycosyltransferase involved in cell wall biosynthesis
MSLGIPILAMINPNNDYGDFIENAGAGYWAVASDKKRVFELFDKICDNNELRKQMSTNGYRYFCSHLTSESAYDILMRQINYGKA